MRLVLASSSPRRVALLQDAGYALAVHPAAVDESRLPAESPPAYVARLAVTKAQAVADASDAGVVLLGADTTVVVDGDVLGKPETEREALEMLSRLEGRAHDVLTGVAILAGARSTVDVARTRVWFRPLSLDIRRAYVASGEPFGKAGAYAVRGGAAGFVDRLAGSYTNVIGLPMTMVRRRLAERGILPAFAATQPR